MGKAFASSTDIKEVRAKALTSEVGVRHTHTHTLGTILERAEANKGNTKSESNEVSFLAPAGILEEYKTVRRNNCQRKAPW